MRLAAATQETLYLKKLIYDIDPMYDDNLPIIIFEDNQNAIALSENQVYHQRTINILIVNITLDESKSFVTVS